MRYDAYRLPGVKWRWVGVGKSPEPDHWPEHVSIEGVKIKTIRGKGWGPMRALYECPECGQARLKLYSSSDSAEQAEQAKQATVHANAQNAVERTGAQGMARVACASHWPNEKIRKDDGLLARERARRFRQAGRWEQHHEWTTKANDLMRLALA